MNTVRSLAERCARSAAANLADNESDTLDKFINAVYDLHATNVEQWAMEDEARRQGASDAEVAHHKRAIDQLNLRRHSYTERIDAAVLAAIAQNPRAEPHTETVGLIVDRLSVLQLRRYHFTYDSRPDSTGVVHRLSTQITDLHDGLDLLLNRLLNGERRIGVYRADKLYRAAG